MIKNSKTILHDLCLKSLEYSFKSTRKLCIEITPLVFVSFRQRLPRQLYDTLYLSGIVVHVTLAGVPDLKRAIVCAEQKGNL